MLESKWKPHTSHYLYWPKTRTNRINSNNFVRWTLENVLSRHLKGPGAHIIRWTIKCDLHLAWFLKGPKQMMPVWTSGSFFGLIITNQMDEKQFERILLVGCYRYRHRKYMHVGKSFLVNWAKPRKWRSLQSKVKRNDAPRKKSENKQQHCWWRLIMFMHTHIHIHTKCNPLNAHVTNESSANAGRSLNLIILALFLMLLLLLYSSVCSRCHAYMRWLQKSSTWCSNVNYVVISLKAYVSFAVLFEMEFLFWESSLFVGAVGAVGAVVAAI